jgi:hypothetical protein
MEPSAWWWIEPKAGGSKSRRKRLKAEKRVGCLPFQAEFDNQFIFWFSRRQKRNIASAFFLFENQRSEEETRAWALRVFVCAPQEKPQKRPIFPI